MCFEFSELYYKAVYEHDSPYSFPVEAIDWSRAGMEEDKNGQQSCYDI